MIAFFPDAYPDELLYSQLARYYKRSGYVRYAYAVSDLYKNDTTAILIANKSFSPCLNCEECDDYCEREMSLFRKVNGEYFLHKYCTSMEYDCEKEEIVPLSLDEAKEVAAFILDGNGYMKIFGIVEE